MRLVKPRSLLLVLPIVASACSLDTLVDKFPLPDTFDVAFMVGEVCVPGNVATGDEDMSYPVRFELCRYRCIDLERESAAVRTVYTCALGRCRMTLLATVTANRNDEEGCDARDLMDPPASECEVERFDFDVPVPFLNGEIRTGEISVYIPFLELEEGQNVIDRLEAGDDPTVVVLEDVGFLGPPERQLTIQFGEEFEVVESHDDIAAEDCHPLEAPR